MDVSKIGVPLVMVKGNFRSLCTLTVEELEAFVTFMTGYSLRKNDAALVNGVPLWWTISIPYKFPLKKPKGLSDLGYRRHLESIVCKCYYYHDANFLLTFSSQFSDNPQSIFLKSNANNTTSVFSIENVAEIFTFDNENKEYDITPQEKPNCRSLLPFQTKESNPTVIADIYLCENCDFEFSTLADIQKHEEECYGTTTDDLSQEIQILAHIQHTVDSSGDDLSGDDSSGDYSSGDYSSGDDPSGDDSSGDDPSGDDSSGDDSSGDDPSGDDPSGDDSSGDDSSGDDPSGDDFPPVDSPGAGSSGDDFPPVDSPGAGSSWASTSEAGPSWAGTSEAGTSEAGPSWAGTSEAGPSWAGTSEAGPSWAGTSEAGPSWAGTSGARTSGVGSSLFYWPRFYSLEDDSLDEDSFEEDLLDEDRLEEKNEFLEYFGLLSSALQQQQLYIPPKVIEIDENVKRWVILDMCLFKNRKIEFSSMLGRKVMEERAKPGATPRLEKPIHPTEPFCISGRRYVGDIRDPHKPRITYRTPKKKSWTHSYCFNRKQKMEKLKILKTGYEHLWANNLARKHSSLKELARIHGSFELSFNQAGEF